MFDILESVSKAYRVVCFLYRLEYASPSAFRSIPNLMAQHSAVKSNTPTSLYQLHSERCKNVKWSYTQKKSIITSQTAETHRACGKPFRPSLTTSPRHRCTSLPDALNYFNSWCEMQNHTPAQKLPTPPNDQALCLSPTDVRKTLSRIYPRMAVGPDYIPGHVLKD